VRWFAFLRVLFGLELDEAGLQLFRACTGRSSPSVLGYLEVALIIGRRGGKSLILALIAAYGLVARHGLSPHPHASVRIYCSTESRSRALASTAASSSVPSIHSARPRAQLMINFCLYEPNSIRSARRESLA
jgi:hypothetical protein